MNRSKAAPRRMGLLGLGVLMAAVPACHGAGPWYRNTGGEPYRVYKPPSTSLRGRPFYVSGYGGADYSRDGRNAVAPVGGVPVNAIPDPALNPASVTVSRGTWDEP
jgi:hypothetical protein